MKKPLKQFFIKNNTLIVKLKGRSMRPFLGNEEVLIVSPVEAQKVLTGDIILYSDNGLFICHRVFRKRGDSFETKGDAGLKPDALIKPEQLIGRVGAIQKGRRTIRLDNLRGRLLNILFSRFSFIFASIYIVIGRLIYCYRKAKNAQRTS